MGDFSFVSKVFTHGDADCGAASTDAHVVAANPDPETALVADQLLMMEAGEISDTTMTMPVNVAGVDGFGTPRHLCLMVLGEDTDDMAAPRIQPTGRIHGDGFVHGDPRGGDRPDAHGKEAGHGHA